MDTGSKAEQLSYGKALLKAAERYEPKAPVVYSAFAVRPMRRRVEKIIAYRPARWQGTMTKTAAGNTHSPITAMRCLPVS